MQGTLQDWTAASLYRLIDERAVDGDRVAANAKHTLDACMPSIQQVLQQGGTSQTDFTLHDAQHGFRVAERMGEITGAVLDQLSGYELALLLLSAYLHDIGMTPKKEQVSQHYRYLLTLESSGLDPGDIDRFRQWLDMYGQDATLPLAAEAPTGTTLHEAEWLTAHYCRERHNDWSVEWIEANLAGQSMGDYPDWQLDLITLCKSHHDGFEQLVQSRFDPVEVGSVGTVVHLRYLAAVLRLADVMEIDPERTPEVLLRQRGVDPSSLIFWHKDQGISLKRDGNCYRLTAMPRSALLHKAIADTADEIERELSVCKRLADEKDLGFLPGSDAPLPHRWELPATLVKLIKPRDDAYEYIDGTFRPDARRLLKLLSGVELYGNELAGVRELLQNAFDAVRERIARERLDIQDDPSSVELLGRLYQVELRLEEVSNAHWLVCRDKGAGMTKAIIRDHLLVSGASKRDDLLRLARHCESAGFRLERTAKFGIGVLSYFMLADEVRIRTRRCQSSRAGEDTGWSFVTDGLNGFGELKRDSDFPEGTEVRLRIKPTVLGGGPYALWRRLVAYVRTVLTNIPCRLIVAAESFPQDQWSVETPGWIRDGVYYAEQSLSVLTPQLRSPTSQADLSPGLDDLIPSDRRDSWEQARSGAQERHDAAHRRLRWSDPITGELPDGLGRYRFFFPWFELDAGPCLHFFEFEEKDGTLIQMEGAEPQRDIGYAPWCPAVMSWFGGQADHGLERLKKYRCPGVVEIDWTSEAAGTIEVSRNQIQPNKRAKRVIWEVIAELKEQLRDFSQKYSKSRFALYNTAVSEAKPPPVPNWYWLCQHETKPRFEWRSLKFPVVTPVHGDDSVLMAISAFRSAARTMMQELPEYAQVYREGRSSIPIDEYRLSGQVLSRYCRVAVSTQPPNQPQTNDEFFSRGYSARTTWFSPNLAPTRVVAIINRAQTRFGVSGSQRTGMLWEQAPKWQKPRVEYPEVEFPPEWQRLCMIVDQSQRIWNRSHTLVQAASGQAWEALMEGLCRGGDPRPWYDKLTSNAELAAAWLLFCLSMGHASLVRGVAEHSPDLLQALWETVFPSHDENECWAKIDDSHGHRLVRVGPFGWEDHDETAANQDVYAALFPEPAREWCIYGVEGGTP